MSDYDKTNTGILSRNERKTEETHADFRGELNCNGVDGWLDGYIRQRKDGSGRFFSLKWKPKVGSAPGKPQAAKTAFDDMPDDIPF